eukprot:gene22751-31040_t
MTEAIPYSPEIFCMRNRESNHDHSFKRSLFSPEYFGSHNKRSRVGNHQPSPFILDEIDDVKRNYESQILAIRSECRQILDKKTQEVESHIQTNKRLTENLQAMSCENKTILEENKILKKAVAIQDNRYRDMVSQNNNLQSVLGQAVERIHYLQDTNKNLSEHINILKGGLLHGHNSFPPPPPDVF